ncbi:hypothetical protein RB195_003326 [Necator americanus]|uniref:Uncharacterized protein n=1 Tax=Necator americanus TaxID=51031 RepID=A0ABR1DN18_NECAM
MRNVMVGEEDKKEISMELLADSVEHCKILLLSSHRRGSIGHTHAVQDTVADYFSSGPHPNICSIVFGAVMVSSPSSSLDAAADLTAQHSDDSLSQRAAIAHTADRALAIENKTTPRIPYRRWKMNLFGERTRNTKKFRSEVSVTELLW